MGNNKFGFNAFNKISSFSIMILVVLMVFSCGEKSITHEEACNYFVELRDNPESVESQRLLRRFKRNIKNYNIEVMSSFGVPESQVEKLWKENPSGQLNTYGTQYFLEVCQGTR